MLLCISIFTYYNPFNLFLGIFSGIGLATYTNFKRKWWGGPFYNAWIVLVLFLMAYFAGVGSITFVETNLIFVVSVIVVLFGYANFVLTGYFKDIFADKSTGYNTLPVQFGRKTSAVVSDLFGIMLSTAVLVLVISLAFNSFPFQTLITSLVFIYTGIGMSVLTQISLHSVKTDNEAHIAISPCVHCYILLLSGLAVLNKPEWFFLLVVFYIFYIITLKIRPAKNQI